MAHSLSAKKRIRQNDAAQQRNNSHKSALKTQARKFKDAIHDSNLEVASKAFGALAKKLDQIAAKGMIHKKQASRRKSRFARQLNALNAGA